jgi:hypothetical protein
VTNALLTAEEKALSGLFDWRGPAMNDMVPLAYDAVSDDAGLALRGGVSMLTVATTHVVSPRLRRRLVLGGGGCARRRCHGVVAAPRNRFTHYRGAARRCRSSCLPGHWRSRATPGAQTCQQSAINCTASSGHSVSTGYPVRTSSLSLLSCVKDAFGHAFSLACVAWCQGR